MRRESPPRASRAFDQRRASVRRRSNAHVVAAAVLAALAFGFCAAVTMGQLR